MLPFPISTPRDNYAAADALWSSGAHAHPASPAAVRWGRELAMPGSWPSTRERRPQAEFLLELVTVVRGMDVFPAESDVLVSWVLLDRHAAAEAPSRFLAATGPDASTSGRPYPWISGYFQYDGSAFIGLGEVQRVDGESHPALHASEPMDADRAFDLIAQAAHRTHQALGQKSPACCSDGASLRHAVSDHLRDHPEIAEPLARRFPLGSGYPPPVLTFEQVAANRRAERDHLNSGSATPTEYRVPIDVMRALLPGGETQLEPAIWDGLREIPRKLKLSPTPFNLAFHVGTVTCLGRQSQRPDLVSPGSIDEMRAAMKWKSGRTLNVRELFSGRYDLATAVVEGLVSASTVRFAKWYGDPDPPPARDAG